MLRPGRFDKKLYVGLPTREGRVDILRSHMKKISMEDGLNLESIASDALCEEFSGVDLEHLIDEARSIAIEEMMQSPSGLQEPVLFKRHFDKAFQTVKSSFSEQRVEPNEEIKTRII
ncbi:tigger transposable element-derived protein 2 [Caerostris extrusa]|uniref:Tigger transposable element-derived protein 2 n=1 Tax=Caerostris extrusa TaxID=172846 RepID=A0AAV4MJT7_CAEEX|nr:tigger transposable element-derived protein 2 [Caerostris extrusa]